MNDWEKASQRARQAAFTLCDLPLASAGQVAWAAGRSYSAISHGLKELQARRWADSAVLGWTRKRVGRWWLTDGGLDAVGVYGNSWNNEARRCLLLDRLPQTESVYDAMARVKNLGAFREFRWLEGMCIDAAVRYEGGWVALLWAGLMETEQKFAARLDRVPYDMELLSDPGSRMVALPAFYCVVVPDQWQRELVYRTVRKYNLEDRVAVWCRADDAWTGVRLDTGPAPPSRGWIQQAAWLKSVGGWPWYRRLESSFSAVENAAFIGQVLEAVAERRGITRASLQTYLGEIRTGKGVQNSLHRLVEQKLLSRRRGGSAPRYALSPTGLNLLARRDRVAYGQVDERLEVPLWAGHPRIQAQEDGLIDMMTLFKAQGWATAAGWRSREAPGPGLVIAPRGMVQLPSSPFGAGWHYVEYEGSKAGKGRLTKALQSYGADGRQDDWPVLAMCRFPRSLTQGFTRSLTHPGAC